VRNFEAFLAKILNDIYNNSYDECYDDHDYNDEYDVDYYNDNSDNTYNCNTNDSYVLEDTSSPIPTKHTFVGHLLDQMACTTTTLQPFTIAAFTPSGGYTTHIFI
jgi:hypothetical protein